MRALLLGNGPTAWLRGALFLALASSCGGLQDGVLSVSFLLEPPPPSEGRTLPPQDRVGVAPLAFGQARGRCDGDVLAHSLRCTFEGLPQPMAQGQALPYDLALLVAYAPLPARFDGRQLERDPGGHDPDAPRRPRPPPLPRRSLGAIRPDPLGVALRALVDPTLPLDRVVGAEVTLALPGEPGASGEPTKVVILDGRVGNLDATGAVTSVPPASASGEHKH